MIRLWIVLVKKDEDWDVAYSHEGGNLKEAREIYNSFSQKMLINWTLEDGLKIYECDFSEILWKGNLDPFPFNYLPSKTRVKIFPRVIEYLTCFFRDKVQ